MSRREARVFSCDGGTEMAVFPDTVASYHRSAYATYITIVYAGGPALRLLVDFGEFHRWVNDIGDLPLKAPPQQATKTPKRELDGRTPR